MKTLTSFSSVNYEEKLKTMRDTHHIDCCFKGIPEWLPDVTNAFDNKGVYHTSFVPYDKHQGFNRRMHGGILAAIIDASMVQCCMGHGIAGYTAHLSIKYSKPVTIGLRVEMITSITDIKSGGIVYSLLCRIKQDNREVAEGFGKLYRYS